MFGQFRALKAEIIALVGQLDSVKNSNYQQNNSVHSKLDDVYSTLIETNDKLAHLIDLLNTVLGVPEGTTPREFKRALEYRKRVENQVGGLVDEIPLPPRSLTGG